MNDCIKEVIVIPKGRTYFYDGKLGVQTTNSHTSDDRYVTLRLIEGGGRIFIRYTVPERMDEMEQISLGIGTEFWGEIDRCHIVRKKNVIISYDIFDDKNYELNLSTWE